MAATALEDRFLPARGRLTFDAEGMEGGGRYHSRRLHVPTELSGLTIGRGYDMKERTVEGIRKDLLKAGLRLDVATTLSEAAGLSGKAASDFIELNELHDLEITPEQQLRLFELTYDWHEADVRRICGKADVVQTYGRTDWDALHPAIRDVLVDLRYRGDYTPATRRHLQKFVARNDLPAFARVLCDRALWESVPRDRYLRRADFLGNAR